MSCGRAAAALPAVTDAFTALASTAGLTAGMGLEVVVNMARIAVAATPPLSACFYPLAVALGKTFKAYKKAKGNKNEAKMLAERAQVSPSARASGVSCERRCFVTR